MVVDKIPCRFGNGFGIGVRRTSFLDFPPRLKVDYGVFILLTSGKIITQLRDDQVDIAAPFICPTFKQKGQEAVDFLGVG